MDFFVKVFHSLTDGYEQNLTQHVVQERDVVVNRITRSVVEANQ
jgi:hypothetical protein